MAEANNEIDPQDLKTETTVRRNLIELLRDVAKEVARRYFSAG